MYETLRRTLTEKGISVYTLARMTGIPNNHLYRSLNGHQNLFPKWRQRIAVVLGYPIEELFPESEVTHDA